MRKTMTYLLVLLCSLIAFGQKQPQWRVVQSVILTHQTAQIPETTIFTPIRQGLYRLSAYMTAFTRQKQQDYTTWQFNFLCTDQSPQGQCGSGMTLSYKAGNGQIISTTCIGSYVFSPRPGTPVSYSTVGSDTPPVDFEYTLAFTIEQLE